MAWLRIRRSKGDQEAAGRDVGILHGQHPATCPVRAVRDWRQTAGILEGPLFRPVNRHDQLQPRRLSDKGVARIVKRAAERAGMDAAAYAGHSLRAGLATAAAAGGAPERAIMKQTGHTSLAIVRRYIPPARSSRRTRPRTWASSRAVRCSVLQVVSSRAQVLGGCCR
jgi:integrase